MKTPHSKPFVSKTRLRKLVKQLKNQQVVAHPTDTIYGLSALADSEVASNILLGLKNRPNNKGLILLSSDIEFVLPFVADLSLEQIKTICMQQERPTTYLVAKNSQTPAYISGQFETVAVRITQHPIIKFLCTQSQSALLSSSANIAGLAVVQSGVKLRGYFGDYFDCPINPNQAKKSQQASQIKHLITQQQYR